MREKLRFIANYRLLLLASLVTAEAATTSAAYGQVVPVAPASRPRPAKTPRRPAPADTLHSALNEVVVSASRVEESFL